MSTIAFQNYCRTGAFEDAKQYLMENPNIDISADNEHAFKLCCMSGNLDFARWLLNVKEDIDISVDEDVIFRMCLWCNKLNMIEFLLSIKNISDKTIIDALNIANHYNYSDIVEFLSNYLNRRDVKYSIKALPELMHVTIN